MPKDLDHFFKHTREKDGFTSMCKECKGRHFTTKLTDPKPKEGYVFCKKCGRELPHDYYHFPVDKMCKTGFRNVCRECNGNKFLYEDFIPSQKWTDEEIEIITKYYKDYTGKELQEKFLPNRTVRAIECEAGVLGIQGKSNETYWRARKLQADAIRGCHRPPMTEEQKKILSEARKRYIEKNGGGWWKGKKRSKEQCKQISERMKKQGYWKGDKNPRHINPLNGEENGRWKGGILPTYTELRSDTKDWQDKSMKFCNYRCVITGSWFKNIHHTTPFRQIVDESFDNLCISIKEKVKDYSNEEFGAVREELKSLHSMYGFGACLNYDVHKLFHDNYGYKDFNGYDFLDFIYRIDTGEFDEWFLQNKLEININYDYVEYLENKLSSLDEVA